MITHRTLLSLAAGILTVSLLGAGCARTSAVNPLPADTLVIPVEVTPDPLAGWQTYTDPAQRFSFQHPAGTFVTADETGRNMTVLPADPATGTVPDMTMFVADGEVSFRTWENFEISYFNQLVSSFTFHETAGSAQR